MDPIETRIAEQKAKYCAGPWQQEPDRVEWRSSGFACLITRVEWSGHLCGYVGVEPGHPWHGKDYNEIRQADGEEWVDVHGGLTYGEHCAGNVCHVPQPGEPEHLFWFGFDCAHSGDASPEDIRRSNEQGGIWRVVPGYQSYRDIDYVRHQVEKLAKQAKAVA